MNTLLDTNVVSALIASRVDPALAQWSERQPLRQQALSVITLAELRFGVECLAAGRRRTALEDRLTTMLPQLFKGRVLSIDEAVADRFGRLLAVNRARGLNLGDRDLMLAATAAVHGLTVVTRNTRHFAPLGVPVLDPWRGAA